MKNIYKREKWSNVEIIKILMKREEKGEYMIEYRSDNRAE